MKFYSNYNFSMCKFALIPKINCKHRRSRDYKMLMLRDFYIRQNAGVTTAQ